MARVVADRVRETSATTGTGALTLAGAVSGFRAMSAVCAVGDTLDYTIVNGSEWEVGVGTYSATNTLTRTSVDASSNGGALVSFSAGTKDVFLTVRAAAVAEATDVEIAAGAAATLLSARRIFTAATPLASSGTGTYSPNLATAINFDRTLTGISTLGLPTNIKVGQSGYILARQDATGSRTLAFNSFWDFGSGAPTASTAASSIDVIPYFVVTSTKALCGFRKGS